MDERVIILFMQESIRDINCLLFISKTTERQLESGGLLAKTKTPKQSENSERGKGMDVDGRVCSVFVFVFKLVVFHGKPRVIGLTFVAFCHKTVAQPLHDCQQRTHATGMP